MSRPKTQARRLAVQAMYQWWLNETSAMDLAAQFSEYETWPKADHNWFHTLAQGVPKHIDPIDDALAEVSDRTIDAMDLIELSILRLGAYELLHHVEIPYKVVVNEYVELAKAFGSDKSYAYVNAALDKLAKRVRTMETA